MIKKNDGIIVEVVRNSSDIKYLYTDLKLNEHPSETSMMNIHADMQIVNSGTILDLNKYVNALIVG